MTFRDTLALAFRNLRQAKLRTLLTTLGVAIGIASLAGMMSLGVGLQDQVVGQLTRSGVFDAVTVTSTPIRTRGFGAPARGRGRGIGSPGSRLGGQAPPPADAPAKRLDDAAVAALAALPHVKDAYPNIRVGLEARYNGNVERLAAMAVPLSARTDSAYQAIPYGTFFTDDTSNTCLLTLDMATAMDPQNPGALVGQTLTLVWPTPSGDALTSALQAAAQNPLAAALAGRAAVPTIEEPFTIVGILERDTSGPLGGALGGSGLMLPMGKARTMVRTPYQAVTVRATAPQYTEDVEAAIKADGYGAFSLNDALQNAKRGFLLLDIILGLIGSIALAVSSLGIVNTMVMSILERTREIGIMKAIGGSDHDVRRIFLVEASSIGLAGGAFGLMLGWVVGRVINIGANAYIRSQGGNAAGNLFAIPLWLVGGALAFSVLVSLIAGSYPANRAAKLNPMAALRHD